MLGMLSGNLEPDHVAKPQESVFLSLQMEAALRRPAKVLLVHERPNHHAKDVILKKRPFTTAVSTT